MLIIHEKKRNSFDFLETFQRGARSIHTAARYGHIGIINTLIQRGEKVDITTNVRNMGFTFMFFICSTYERI